MDPFTITILLIIALLTGGGLQSASQTRRRNQLLVMRDAVRSKAMRTGEATASVFDVFWDLGASEFAIEVMAAQRFLPTDLQDLAIALDQIEDAIKDHGSYETFIRENLEAIEEMYQEHRRAGHRRFLPLLEQRQHKTLELPAVTPTQRALPGPQTRRPDSVPMLEFGLGSWEVDIDAMVRVDPFAMLKSVFFGDAAELDRWWTMRSVRGLKDRLDRHLTELYDAYVFEATRNPDFFNHLYDVAHRWDLEARRLDELREMKIFRGRNFGHTAEALIAEGAALAQRNSNRARSNVDQTIELIHSHARHANLAMAGYLVYLNYMAIFAGRLQRVGAIVQNIENTSHKLQEEMREVSRRA